MPLISDHRQTDRHGTCSENAVVFRPKFYIGILLHHSCYIIWPLSLQSERYRNLLEYCNCTKQFLLLRSKQNLNHFNIFVSVNYTYMHVVPMLRYSLNFSRIIQNYLMVWNVVCSFSLQLGCIVITTIPMTSHASVKHWNYVRIYYRNYFIVISTYDRTNYYLTL